MIAMPLNNINILSSLSQSQITQAIYAFYQLTPLLRRILFSYYKARLKGYEKTNWSCAYLAIKFGVTRTYMSHSLAQLEELGWLKSEHRGRNTKNRWITPGAFIVLENKTRHQSEHQNEPIPYIDLSVKDDQILLKGGKGCGQVVNDQNLSPEQKLEYAMSIANLPYRERVAIKSRFKDAKIGSERKKSLISRLLHTLARKTLTSVKSYFLSAFLREEKAERQWFNYFKQKNLDVELLMTG